MGHPGGTGRVGHTVGQAGWFQRVAVRRHFGSALGGTSRVSRVTFGWISINLSAVAAAFRGRGLSEGCRLSDKERPHRELDKLQRRTSRLPERLVLVTGLHQHKSSISSK